MKTLYLLFILPAFAFGQPIFDLTKDVESKGYAMAIGEYIKAVHAKNKTTFDTLFFGKYEDFPDIKLPSVIENTKIVLLSNEDAEKKYASRRSITYINIVGDFSRGLSFFKLIVFKTEKQPEKIYWWPLHVYNADYNYSLGTKAFKLEKTSWEYPYSNKYADKK